MKKILFIYLTPLFLFAQEKENNHSVEWNSNFLFESNGLDKSFLSTMLYGGYINSEMKTEWINTGNKNNIVHSEISNGVSYTYHFKKLPSPPIPCINCPKQEIISPPKIVPEQSIGFSFSDRNLLNAKFSDNLLRIGFEGNYNYQDQKLGFDNTNIRADRFQQYKLSYSRFTNKASISAGISYLAGNHHLSYIIEKGSLYTAPLGTSLSIQYDMKAVITDSSNFSIFTRNGNGIAVDFSTGFNIKKYYIHLSITDLGFIKWKPSSITLATDSNFNFQGIEVEDIFSFNDSLLDANNLKNDVFRTQNTSFKSYIPATIHAAVSRKIGHNYFKIYTAGVIAKWQPYMDNKTLSF